MKFESLIWKLRTYVKYGVWTKRQAGQYLIELFYKLLPLYENNRL
jgi:hypothetical protein